MINRCVVFRALWIIVCFLPGGAGAQTFPPDNPGNADQSSIEAFECAWKVETCSVQVAYALSRWYRTGLTIDEIVDKLPPNAIQRAGVSFDEALNLLATCSLFPRVIEGSYETTVADTLDSGTPVIVPDIENRHLRLYFRRAQGTLECFDPPRRHSWVPEEEVRKSFPNLAVAVYSTPPARQPLKKIAHGPLARNLLLALILLGFATAVVVLILKRRRKCATTAVLLAATALFYAGKSGWCAETAPAGKPDPFVREYVFDCGMLQEGQTAKRIFEVANPFDQEFIVERVTPFCNCADYELSSNRIPPGGNFTMTITLRPKPGEAGKATGKVLVSDASNPPRIMVFKLDYELPQDDRLRASEAKLNFGEVVSGASSRRYLCVKRMDNGPIVFEGMPTSNNPHVVLRQFPDPVSKDGRYVFEVAVVSQGLAPGYFSAEITFAAQGPNQRRLTIPTTARVVEEVRSIPERLFLGAIGSAQQEWQVKLESRLNRPFTIVSASTTLGDGWTVSIDPPCLRLARQPSRAYSGGEIVTGEIQAIVRNADGHEQSMRIQAIGAAGRD